MDRQANRFYEFGHFRIDEVERVLLRAGEPLPLTAKVFDILLLLIENRGHVVEKDRLMKEIWPDAFVEEGNLTQNISVLRKVLSEGEDSLQYIQTIPRRGYRFVGGVRELDYEQADLIVEEHSRATIVIEQGERAITPAASPSETVTTNQHPVRQETSRPALTHATSIAEARRTSMVESLARRISLDRRAVIVTAVTLAGVLALVASINYFSRRNNPAINSIAVMPFVNVGGDANTEYLSDGVTESLIESLSRIPNLSVKSRSSVFRYHGQQIDPQVVGRDLNVQAVLTGRLVQRGDALSISLELVDTSDNTHIWGEQYNRKLSDILTIQGDISQAISERLRLKLSGDEQQRLTKRYTDNTEAYQLYLQGRYYWNKRTGEGLKKSRGYYEKAIEKDPGYALAYAGLADSYIVSAAVLPPGEKYPKTKAAALKALEIDNTLADPHAALARVIFEYDWDFAGAEKEFQQAIKMNPNYATAHQYYALFLSAMGRSEEALREAQRAQALDPISLNINVTLGNVHKFARRYDQAVDQFKKIIEMDQNWPNAHDWLADAYELKGMNDAAVTETLNYLTLGGAKPETLPALRAAYTASGVKGFWRKQLDMLMEESKQTYVPPVYFAYFYARLGDKDKVFEWLEKAYQEHDSNLPYLKVASPLDSLRSDPRFTDLLRRVGLTP